MLIFYILYSVLKLGATRYDLLIFWIQGHFREKLFVIPVDVSVEYSTIKILSFLTILQLLEIVGF
jgi:hypothetical protein